MLQFFLKIIKNKKMIHVWKTWITVETKMQLDI